MAEFAGWNAVVTGGGGLLGRGMATVFARHGMNVVVADVDEAAAERVAKEVVQLGRNGFPVRTDVTDLSSVRNLATVAYAELGNVNLVCNNAGISRRKPFEELTPEDWNAVLSVNLEGVLNGVLAFLPYMLERDGPRHFVNTSSMSGVGRADLRVLNAPYVTSKFAVVGLTETMAPALRDKGIGASVLCPGLTVADPDGPVQFKMPSGRWYEHNLLGAEAVAEEVLRGVAGNRLHIFPHEAGLGEVLGRHELLLESFRQAGNAG